MKRPIDETPEAAGGCNDEGWAGKHPIIVAYLCDGKWEDGKARETSKLQVTLQEGRFVASLQDVALQRSLFISGPTLGKALEALERALASPGADWRKWRGGSRKK